VYRYLREAIDVLAAQAIPLERTVYLASRLIYLILDGTLVPIDGVAEDRPCYSGKHKRHGVNVQVRRRHRRLVCVKDLGQFLGFGCYAVRRCWWSVSASAGAR
jgi:hypothetical protein